MAKPPTTAALMTDFDTKLWRYFLSRLNEAFGKEAIVVHPLGAAGKLGAASNAMIGALENFSAIDQGRIMANLASSAVIPVIFRYLTLAEQSREEWRTAQTAIYKNYHFMDRIPDSQAIPSPENFTFPERSVGAPGV